MSGETWGEWAQREREAAITREKILDALAVRGETPWSEVEALVASKRPHYEYERAVMLLTELRVLAECTGTGNAFSRCIEEIRARYTRNFTSDSDSRQRSRALNKAAKPDHPWPRRRSRQDGHRSQPSRSAGDLVQRSRPTASAVIKLQPLLANPTPRHRPDPPVQQEDGIMQNDIAQALPHRSHERSFAWFGRNQRLSKHYEHHHETGKLLLDLAMSRVSLPRPFSQARNMIAEQSLSRLGTMSSRAVRADPKPENPNYHR